MEERREKSSVCLPAFLTGVADSFPGNAYWFDGLGNVMSIGKKIEDVSKYTNLYSHKMFINNWNYYSIYG